MWLKGVTTQIGKRRQKQTKEQSERRKKSRMRQCHEAGGAAGAGVAEKAKCNKRVPGEVG